MRNSRLLIVLALLFLPGCADSIGLRFDPCVAPAELPVIRTAADGRDFLDLSVLIYNVEGLPWPARKNRGPQLDRIGDELARLRAAGQAPDIVMLQEAFTRRAAKIGVRAGYPNIASGPAAGDRARHSADLPERFIRDRRFWKGERAPKLLNSGLFILSDYPIISLETEPFSRHACAGFDCLANKGVMRARMWIPGMPDPIDVLTTHMNSQRAARVDLERAHAAHRYQTDESADFLSLTRDDRNPMIFGGDFNMRNAPGRLDYFTYGKPHRIVRHYCTVVVSDCDVRMSWDGDAPWLDTQDLQFFDSGATVKLRPIRAESMFDRVENGRKLSDHDGYMVTYRLSWPGAATGEWMERIARARAADRPICIDG